MHVFSCLTIHCNFDIFIVIENISASEDEMNQDFRRITNILSGETIQPIGAGRKRFSDHDSKVGSHLKPGIHLSTSPSQGAPRWLMLVPLDLSMLNNTASMNMSPPLNKRAMVRWSSLWWTDSLWIGSSSKPSLFSSVRNVILVHRASLAQLGLGSHSSVFPAQKIDQTPNTLWHQPPFVPIKNF